MITRAYVRTMSRYNRWQNRQVLAACDTLTPQALTEDRGAFFGSILGTLSHLMWGDALWMSRFDSWDKPHVGIAGSARFVPDWPTLRRLRPEADARIAAWADALPEDGLAGDLAWFSGAAGREVSMPLTLCVTHFFNHQTHHRGQVHAMLTAAGARPGDTDLFLMPDSET
ncbi:DinB family protein [Actibacterium sp. MT2.3-13A]|uniref:DinB family protein n=1 Tax=Actibacterium sp. MT2.3-13A TaxID=2828332 RepID=UPI001BAE051E|nr:DinB family protein [Actibacterium sp. MT2.3-13A]